MCFFLSGSAHSLSLSIIDNTLYRLCFLWYSENRKRKKKHTKSQSNVPRVVSMCVCVWIIQFIISNAVYFYISFWHCLIAFVMVWIECLKIADKRTSVWRTAPKRKITECKMFQKNNNNNNETCYYEHCWACVSYNKYFHGRKYGMPSIIIWSGFFFSSKCRISPVNY